MKQCGVLDLSFAIGEALLENGAEISRVQETMERVARSYHVDKYNVFVLTNAVFANGIENGVTHTTEIRYIKNTRIHIGRISALNQLSREITEGKYQTVADAYEKLQQIKNLPYASLPVSMLACGVASAASSLIFGGAFIDAAAAFFCGLIMELFLYYTDKRKFSKFLVNLTASAIVTCIAVLLTALGAGTNLDKVIIGSIIRLVPGVALTTSIRDFFNGDYLSGAIRMIDALLIGGCIGIGVGVVIRISSILFEGMIL